MFKTESIILSVDTIRDSNIRVVLLTKEYGKISVWYKKKQFPHDMGDIIFTTIDRQGSLNLLKYTESMMSPREEQWSYQKIRIFLESIALIRALAPEMVPYMNIFRDYKGLLTHMQTQTSLHEHHYLLFQFRVLRLLGYIGGDSFQDTPISRYIYEHILSTPLSKLLGSKELGTEDARKIELANKEAIYRSSL